MKYGIILTFMPLILWAQDLEFQQEYDTILVEIETWQAFSPWAGGEAVGGMLLDDAVGRSMCSSKFPKLSLLFSHCCCILYTVPLILPQ